MSEFGSTPTAKRAGLGTLHLFLLVPWIGLVVAARGPLRDNSFLWHVRAGELQLDGGAVLTADPFSFTRLGDPWRTQSWLADLFYRQLEIWVGLRFVPWLILIAGGVAIGAVGIVAWRRSQSLVGTAAALVLLGWVGVGFLSPRPVLFSYLFIAVLMVVVSDTRLRWTLPILMWAWASVHGSFVVGLGLIVLTGLQQRRPWRRDLGVSLVAVTLTAHGIGAWQTLVVFLRSRDALNLISEWAPPRLTGLDLAPYALFLLLMMVGLARGRLSQRDLWVIAPMALFGLTAARAVFPAALVLAPYVAAVIGEGSHRLDTRRSPTARPVLVVAALIILGLPFAIRPTWEGLSADRFPVEVAKSLDASPVFHDDVVGGYLIYAEGPERLVMVDDRAELFGVEGFTDVLEARRAHSSWEATFSKYDISQALLEVDDGLVELLSRIGWRRVAFDDNFVLLAAP